MSKETLKLALEALEESLYATTDKSQFLAFEAITAIKQAFAKQEQGEQDTLAYREAASLAQWLFNKHFAHEEHYASGRVVWGLCDTTAGVISQIDNMVCKLVREQEQGEPVAWMDDEGIRVITSKQKLGMPERLQKSFPNPLYTTPQQRKPLTDEQIMALLVELCVPTKYEGVTETFTAVVRTIEAAHGIKE